MQKTNDEIFRRQFHAEKPKKNPTEPKRREKTARIKSLGLYTQSYRHKVTVKSHRSEYKQYDEQKWHNRNREGEKKNHTHIHTEPEQSGKKAKEITKTNKRKKWSRECCIEFSFEWII